MIGIQMFAHKYQAVSYYYMYILIKNIYKINLAGAYQASLYGVLSTVSIFEFRSILLHRNDYLKGL